MHNEFDKKVEQLKELTCLGEAKSLQKRYDPSKNSIIFFIRQTRYFLIVRKDYRYSRSIKQYKHGVTMDWYFKSKSRNSFKEIEFSEVLGSTWLSKKAKTELVFNLDKFIK